MSSMLLGLVLIVLITLMALVLWKLSVWISVRIAGRDPGASVAGGLRPEATVPVGRRHRGRPAPYPRRELSLSDRVLLEDMPLRRSRPEGLSLPDVPEEHPSAVRTEVLLLFAR